MAALPAPKLLPAPPPPPPASAGGPAAQLDTQEQAASGRRVSSKTRYLLAMETADVARAELGAAVLDGRPVQELAQLLARLAKLEAQVTVADRRYGLVARLANAAGRRLQ
jgi:hypothetical protein